MARYNTARFEEAASAYVGAFGLVPAANTAGTEEGIEETQKNAEALAAKLGEAHPAHPELVAVATLRGSIARRFIRLSVAPLAEAAAEAKKAEAAKEARAAAAAARKSKKEGAK